MPLHFMIYLELVGQHISGGLEIAQHIPYPVSYTHLRAHETSLHLVCRLLLEKKNFLWRSYRVKTNQKVIYRALLLFSQTMLSYCFGMLSEFAKVFERKIWRVQVAHLHNVGVGVGTWQISLRRWRWSFKSHLELPTNVVTQSCQSAQTRVP